MKIPNIPASEMLCERYAVTLNTIPTVCMAARVSAMPYNWGWPGEQRSLDQTEIAGFVRCESNEPVEVCVTLKDPFEEICLRPLHAGVALEREGQTVRFTLPGPGQYILEPNDFHRALHLFVAPECQLPVQDENILYYGPGVHEIGLVELHSNQTVILDAEAVVYGGFVAYGAENITITGTGVLDGSKEVRTSDTGLIAVMEPEGKAGEDEVFLEEQYLRNFIKDNQVLNGCIRFYHCRNCKVEHITCRDSSTFTIVPAICENVVIEDVKLIGMWRYNSDGIDFFNCTNCVIRNSFLRNFDDCVVIKGIFGWGHRRNENILVENCVVWCDWGRALEIGAETNASEYVNILFRNCDVVHGSWLLLDIQHHNDAYIHDVVFDNIRCEYTRHQQPMKIQGSKEEKYEEAKPVFAYPALLGAFCYDMGLFGSPHGKETMERIRFKDIQVLSDEEVPMQAIQFQGLNEDCCIRDVVLENITRNGVALKDPKSANLQCNAFAYDVILK